jgi:hypothetical chaperone protein
MKPIAYGIDFGTTNSVLAVAYPDRTEVMTELGLSMLRSVVYLDRHGTRTAGEQALRQFLSNPDTRTARVMLDVKACLADEHFDRTDVFGRSLDLETLAGIIFSYLKLLADRATGSDTRRAVIGFPVAFPDAIGDRFEIRQNLALDRLCDAANRAGFEEVVPIEEPAAAAGGESAGLYATLDFGGGTFDVAVVRRAPEADEVLALTGAPIGGEELTGRLFASSVAPLLGLTHPRMPARYRHYTRTMSDVLNALFERDLDPRVFRECAPRYQAIRDSGFLYDLYDAVEIAKCELSTRDETLIRLDRRGFHDVQVRVTRDGFEDVIRDRIEGTLGELERALERARVSASDVELVTLTGGSSRIPLFREGVRGLLPEAKLEDRDPFGRVAQGLADQARVCEW